MNKYLIIGDIHGCISEFFQLLDKVNITKEPRIIISVGDILDKNPGFDNYVSLLEFFIATNSIMVLGNHEEKHLRFHKQELSDNKNRMQPAINPEKHKDFWNTRNQILKYNNGNLFSWLAQCKYYFYIPEYPYVVIHGGLEPHKKPEEHNPKILCRVRNLNLATNKMVHIDKITNDTPFWTHQYDPLKTFKKPMKIIYGHAPHLNPRIELNTFGLDTGCCYGNKLTGLLLPEKEIVSIDAQKQYAELEFKLENNQ